MGSKLLTATLVASLTVGALGAGVTPASAHASSPSLTTTTVANGTSKAAIIAALRAGGPALAAIIAPLDPAAAEAIKKNSLALADWLETHDWTHGQIVDFLVSKGVPQSIADRIADFLIRISTNTTKAFSRASTSTVERLRPYVSITTKGYSLDLPEAVAAQTDPTELANIRDHIKAVNEMIARGEIDAPASDGTQLRHAFQGAHGWLDFTWYGAHVWLDKYYTEKLKAGLAAAGGVAGILAAIGATGGGAVVAGIIAAAAVAMVGMATVCQKPAGDVHLYLIRTPTGVLCNPL